MSQPDLYEILDSCVDRIGRGDPVERCLASHPQQASELAPALALSAELLQIPRLEPAQRVTAAGRARMMAAFNGGERRGFVPFSWLERRNGISRQAVRRNRGLATLLKGAVAIALMLLIAGSLAVTAAADTLPGDTLYPIKRTWEEARMAVTLQESARRQLTGEMERRRRQEVEAVLELGRQAEVEFVGQLQTVTPAMWLVDGLEVRISSETEIGGDIQPGKRVAVRARVAEEGILTALKISARPEEGPSPIAPTTAPSPHPTQPAATATLAPTRGAPATLEATPLPPRTDLVEATATSPAVATISEPPTREASATPTATHQPTREPAATFEATRAHLPSRTPEPTLASHQDVAATSTPEKRPTDAPTAEATATQRPVTDVRPSPTPTQPAAREPTPTREATPTPQSNSLGDGDRPP